MCTNLLCDLSSHRLLYIKEIRQQLNSHLNGPVATANAGNTTGAGGSTLPTGPNSNTPSSSSGQTSLASTALPHRVSGPQRPSQRAPSSAKQAQQRLIRDEVQTISQDRDTKDFWQVSTGRHPMTFTLICDQGWLRDTLQEITGCSQISMVESYIPIEPIVADAFERGDGPGPDVLAPKFDFRDGASLLEGWNNACIDIVIPIVRRKASEYQARLPYEIPPVPDAYLKAKLQTMLRNWYTKYKETRLQEFTDGTLESQEERVQRVTEMRETRNEHNNRAGRRNDVSGLLPAFIFNGEMT
jgi:hypothetical protein